MPTYRAEVPLYAALPEQLRQANLAMLGNLHQRVGDDGPSGAAPPRRSRATARPGAASSAPTAPSRRAAPCSPTSRAPDRLPGRHRPVGRPELARRRLRRPARRRHARERLRQRRATSPVGSNDLRSQYLGAYATWKNDSGLYVDGVLQAGRHRYTASPDAEPRQSRARATACWPPSKSARPSPSRRTGPSSRSCNWCTSA